MSTFSDYTSLTTPAATDALLINDIDGSDYTTKQITVANLMKAVTDGLVTPLASAKVIVGDAGGQAAAVTLTGDCTMANTGAISIGADKVAATELGVTAGTAAASKALVLDGSKGIATITSATITTLTAPTVNATDIDAGASGTAGTVDVFPTTGSKGKLSLAAVDSAADHTVTISNASHGQASVYTIPDVGAATGYLWSFAAAQTAAGVVSRADLVQDALASYPIPFPLVRAADGAALGIADTGDSGDHYLAFSANTWKLMGNSPSSNTQTDVSLFQFALPPEFDDGETVTVRVNGEYTTIGDTQTLDLECYKVNKTDASVGSDICATNIQTLTATDAAFDFTITPTGLVGGDLLNLKLTTVFEDNNGTVGEAEINSIEAMLDIKG